MDRGTTFGGSIWIEGVSKKGSWEFFGNILSHFLESFWAAWWASRPSERLLSVLQSTISVFCRPPNHFTRTQSLEVGSPSGPFTTFPGHALQPRAAPQIKSPTVKLEFDLCVVGSGFEFESSDSTRPSGAIGFIVLTGGDSFNKSKSLFVGLPLSSFDGVADRWHDDDDADSAIFLWVLVHLSHVQFRGFNFNFKQFTCECNDVESFIWKIR